MTSLVCAFLLDLCIGDPFYAWHPIRLMGRAVEKGENFFRKLISNERWAGGVLAAGLPVLTFLLAWILIALAGRIHPALALVLQVFGIYTALSIHDLRREALRIYEDLKSGDLSKARQDLGRIVGRDTETLEASGIVRGTVEAVAESTVDGIMAPLFYAAIGGAPLALAYKAVNTLDSMIGHLNARYRDFGFVAAKQDELWNWIPARLSWPVTAFASFCLRHKTRAALAAGWQDGVARGRGNSNIPEAAFAGALGLRLGGPSTYQGRKVEKPFLGTPQKDFEAGDILKSVKLMMAASWITLGVSLLIKGVVGYV